MLFATLIQLLSFRNPVQAETKLCCNLLLLLLKLAHFA